MTTSIVPPAGQWLAVAVLAAALLAMLGVLGAARDRLHPEVARKAAHVGLGTALSALPWLLRDVAAAAALVAMAIVVMLAIRRVPALRARYGRVVHDVRRSGHGDLHFPIAALALFAAARDEPALYVAPMLALTFADAAAALVGLRFGRTRYRTRDGRKSLEGSLACFLAAMPCAHASLVLLAGLGALESLLASCCFAMLVTLIEALAWRGLDNLWIPIGGFLLLRLLVPLDAAALATILSLAAGGVLACLVALEMRGRRALRWPAPWARAR